MEETAMAAAHRAVTSPDRAQSFGPHDEVWGEDSKATEKARRACRARNASGRRRLVDPTTCERDYSADEMEFLRAVEEYKRRSGRMFPTWSEVLEVVRGLGYGKRAVRGMEVAR
jgi:hypothetical protein